MNLLYSAFILEDSEAKGFLKKVISQCNVFKKEFSNIKIFSKFQGTVLGLVLENISEKK